MPKTLDEHAADIDRRIAVIDAEKAALINALRALRAGR